MDCVLIREELFAYHFGACEDATRDELDEHLVSCSACLRTYLALKRRIEVGASERPSPEARDRLRASVEKRWKPKRSTKVTALFQRKIPVYQGIFAVAVAACVAFAVPSAVRAVRSAGGTTTPDEPRIDTARHAAESLSIF